jgi:transposase
MSVRNTLKIFGTVDLYLGRFLYHFQQVFNAKTYIEYLEQVLRRYFPKKIFLIQDNAAYHKDKQVWSFFSQERKHIEVFNLPVYSPEFNALERIWHHVRVNGTHDRFFPTQEELYSTLVSTFKSIQRNPLQIMGYLNPFQ